MNNNSMSVKRMTYCAMFAAIATILMYFEFPLPFMPPFLKIDLSGTVTLLAAFMFGWLPALLITAVKDFIHFFSSTTGGVGQLADLMMMTAFSATAALIYRRMHTRRGAVLGLAAGSVAMTAVSVFTNRYMLIPFFSKVMPISAILDACAAVNPLIGDINTYVLFGVVPFNLIKCLVLSLLTMLLYKRLSVFIRGNSDRRIKVPEASSHQAGEV